VVVVIGVGNPLRGDDGAGLAVVGALRAHLQGGEIALCEQEGEPLGMLEQWKGARAAVIVDAVRSGAAPGTIHRVEATPASIPARPEGRSSTHALGVVEAIELARALKRLPPRVVLFGIEGESFQVGSAFSAPVAAALPTLTRRVLLEVRGLARQLVSPPAPRSSRVRAPRR